MSLKVWKRLSVEKTLPSDHSSTSFGILLVSLLFIVAHLILQHLISDELQLWKEDRKRREHYGMEEEICWCHSVPAHVFSWEVSFTVWRITKTWIIAARLDTSQGINLSAFILHHQGTWKVVERLWDYGPTVWILEDSRWLLVLNCKPESRNLHAGLQFTISIIPQHITSLAVEWKWYSNSWTMLVSWRPWVIRMKSQPFQPRWDFINRKQQSLVRTGRFYLPLLPVHSSGAQKRSLTSAPEDRTAPQFSLHFSF